MLRNAFTEILLKHIRIDSHIDGFAAQITIQQIFSNITSDDIEVIYYFPYEINATISSFIARFDDQREIHAELKDRTTITQQTIENPPKYFFQDNDQINDTFSINLGILKSHSQCEIELTYITVLDLVQRNILRLVIPKFLHQTSYTFDFICQIIDNKTSYVSCLSHLNAMIQDKRNDESKIYVKLTNILMDKDIIIDVFILSANYFENISSIQSNAIMTGFISSTRYDRMNNHEFIFLVDCNQSMEMNLVRETLSLFLNKFDIHHQFNIISFDSTFQLLFNQTNTDEYSKLNSKKAKKFIQNLKTNLNRTELIKPLYWLYRRPPKLNHSRQIILLTNGQISHIEQTIDLCRKMATNTRIFTIGLGFSPNRAVIKTLARLTNGKCTIIPSDAKPIYYIADQLQRIFHPSFNNINTRWSHSGQNNPIQWVTHIHSTNVIFAETCFLVYALLDDAKMLKEKIKIELIEFNEQEKEHCLTTINIDPRPQMDYERNNLIARLAAKVFIQELIDQNRDENYQLMRNISLKFGITCPLTTFVGIEKQFNSDKTLILNEKQIPIHIYPQYFTQNHANYQVISNQETESNWFRSLKSIFSNPPSSSIINHQSPDLVYYLIEQQQASGLWHFSHNLFQNLIHNQIPSNFPSRSTYPITDDMFITALIILLLEQRYPDEKIFWISIINKAKQRLSDLLKSTESNNKHDQLDILLNDLRKHISKY